MKLSGKAEIPKTNSRCGNRFNSFPEESAETKAPNIFARCQWDCFLSSVYAFNSRHRIGCQGWRRAARPPPCSQSAIQSGLYTRYWSKISAILLHNWYSRYWSRSSSRYCRKGANSSSLNNSGKISISFHPIASLLKADRAGTSSSVSEKHDHKNDAGRGKSTEAEIPDAEASSNFNHWAMPGLWTRICSEIKGSSRGERRISSTSRSLSTKSELE